VTSAGPRLRAALRAGAATAVTLTAQMLDRHAHKTALGRARLHLRLGLVAFAVVAIIPACASAVERPATPATFASVFAASGAGDTIILGDGDYGTFTGALKPGMVTIRGRQGGQATMALAFEPASNITIDGLTLTEIAMADSATKHIVVRNSTISGQTVLRTATLAESDILFDHNHHGAWDKCSSCGEGRVFLPERTIKPSGITIQNSIFGPGGNSDGIQNGSNGTRILNNEFTGIKQIDGDEVHADSIQLYGSQNTVIKGNWFHDVSVGVMCPDACDHEVVEDNVFAVNGSPYSMTLLSDDGSQIVHNTFLDYGLCDYSTPCGVLYLGNKSADPPSHGTVVRDNILTRICVCDGSVSGLGQEDFNLLRQGGTGAHDLRASPIFVGGKNPASVAGFALADGSAGTASASDGLDRGARLAAAGVPATAAPPPATPAAPLSTVRVKVLSRLATAIRTGTLRLSVQSSLAGSMRVATSMRPGRPKRGRRPVSRKVLRLKAVSLGPVRAGTRRVAVPLSRVVRRRLAQVRDARVSVRVTVGSQSVTVGGLTLRR
jgi:hypothetical protein